MSLYLCLEVLHLNGKFTSQNKKGAMLLLLNDCFILVDAFAP